jgi:transcriptional regulator with XRE-family HTH domain
MAATPGRSPVVAKQRVRRALRKARDETPMSQGDVAKLLGWSLSKMQRIEGGEVAISPTDLRALLDVYGIEDQDRVKRLAEDAHTSRRERYVTAPEHREYLTASMRELMQFEREAVSIRQYQPVAYPGILQTPAVAEAVINRWTSDPEARRVRFEARMARRKQVIEGEDGPEYFLVLEQAVITKLYGGEKATAEQLEDLADLAQRDRLHIRVVPRDKGADAMMLGPFQILSLDHGDDSVIYTESHKNDAMHYGPQGFDLYSEAFEHLWDIALSESASRRLMVAEAAALRFTLDR